MAAGAAFAGVFKFRGDLLEAGVAATVAALLFPFVTLLVKRKRRHGKFAAQFPDAMDIIVRSLRAGHPVPVAVGLVAQELPDPIGTEFGIAADEITYGADVETAMRNLYFRVGQEDLPLFVTAVAIQGSTGGNLSEILSNLSSVIRQRFKMRRKIKALAAEGKFSAIFLSGLPVAVFVLINFMTPDFYGSIIKYDLTKWGLGLAAAWMLAGQHRHVQDVQLPDLTWTPFSSSSAACRRRQLHPDGERVRVPVGGGARVRPDGGRAGALRGEAARGGNLHRPVEGADDDPRSLRYASKVAAQRLIDYTAKHYSTENKGETKELRRQLLQAGFLDHARAGLLLPRPRRRGGRARARGVPADADAAQAGQRDAVAGGVDRRARSATSRRTST